MRKFLPLLVFLACAGCGGITPSKNPDQVDITGRVALPGGKPLTDVNFNLQPTGNGTQAVYYIKGGEFKGKATPGKYTWFISEGSKDAAYQVVPQKYRAGALDRQIDVGSGTSLNLTLE